MIIQAGDVTLDDLDISGFTSSGGGPAISIYNTASSLTATNLDLDANTASSTVGGHINCFQASMDISNSSMSRGLAARPWWCCTIAAVHRRLFKCIV